ncbi:TraB/GumN family protein [Cohnella cholangitidis]|uniref:TraB/GumN family protein n=1 Tax=Cohnella cholangitidis TaxID=2598458 RepID=A0A7G5BW43_9BACL|nr:TraB/GumN family protein [Cohnella cholangitidis]QMV41177.1 TraB/GumN family protein [Cohnella cholangitidis]
MNRRAFRFALIWMILAAMTVLAACSGNAETLQTAETPTPPSASSTATEQPIASKQADVPEKSGSKGYLWKITGGKNSGYLAGTIHIARKEMYPLDADLERAIAQADYIALELDLTKVDQKKVLDMVNDKALLTDGTTLKDHVAEEDYAKFQSILKKSILSAGAAAFDKYEPWYAAMTLESLPAMKYMMYDGIDQYIAKQAHKDGKEIIELESMESQLGIFDGFSDEMQQLYFHQTVESAAAASIGLKQLLDMWTLGDLKLLKSTHDQFEKEGKKSMGEEFDEYNDSFLVKRNIGMVDKIDQMLNEGEAGTYLIAVGSLHMVGEQGLVSLLEDKGYTVEFIE